MTLVYSNAFLRDERATYDVDSIQQYLQEAKAGSTVFIRHL